MFVLGLDLGTQGVRALVVDSHGAVASQADVAFPSSMLASQDGLFEQNVAVWRNAVRSVLQEIVAGFESAGRSADAIAAISVTSTSGTLCLVDEHGEPVRPAIMYSDTRAASVTPGVQQAGAALSSKLGSKISASWALPRILWVMRNEPELFERVRWALSPTDVVIGWLTEEWGASDWSNMLKTGYDVMDACWPSYISRDLGIPERVLSQVSPPGTSVASVSESCATETGLSSDTMVVSGATDGTCSQLASGAVAPGQWNSTLGTTLVLKGVTEQILRDPVGRIYCHRHPDGHWLPGGASSAGADCLSMRFGRDGLDALNETALILSPSGILIYPLMRQGERFPFSNPDAEGFEIGVASDEPTRYAAHLEGIACIERMCYEVVESLGGVVGDSIHAAGGGSRSLAGLQIRADMLGREMVVPEITAGAMGAAILAMRGVTGDCLADVAGDMVRTARTVSPRANMIAAYDEQYQAFRDACQQRGYVQ